MPTLRKDLRSQLEKTILKARVLAEQGALEALTTLGVDQSKQFDHLKPEQKKLRNQLRALGRQAGDVLDERTDRQTLEHLAGAVAYEHWHRMLFARFLAENSLLLESEHQVPVSLADVAELARDAKVDIWELAGIYAQRMLPAVFRPDDPVLVLTLARETRTGLEKLVTDLPCDVFLASDSLGWTYQFWQTQKKKEVNESEVKIGADELPSVTQLFTEDYMVDFLLDNTLGAWWAGKKLALNPQLSSLKSEIELRETVALPGCPWSYLRFIKAKDGKWTPAAGTFDGWPKSSVALRALDPCMGSGHFVVAMFERLVALRLAEEKLNEAAAVAAVIRDNLFGLEIDPRCTQIAAFNLALAAWRRVGHRPLPAMNLACSGLAPNTRREEWLKLTEGAPHLRFQMGALYDLFEKAPVLGSLINPRADKAITYGEALHELQPLLEKALEQETKDDTAHEMAVTARGLAKAAEILAGQFTLVATNVPYLGRGKQEQTLKEYSERVYPKAKADLATCFIERCLEFCSVNATTALVTPISWLFQPNYTDLREAKLAGSSFLFSVRLGSRAFETITGEVVKAALVAVTRERPTPQHVLSTIDATGTPGAAAKAEMLRASAMGSLVQSTQLKNPDAVIGQDLTGRAALLSAKCQSFQGLCTSDDAQFIFEFWELPTVSTKWRWLQSAALRAGIVGGCSSVLFWEEGGGRYYRHAQALKAEGRLGGWKSGGEAWSKRGVAVNVTKNLHANFYLGDFFDNTIAALIPSATSELAAIHCFVASEEYKEALRELDPSLSVTEHTLLKVPFDLAHWQKVAAEKYPHGLPKPFSSDPTQWLFDGQPKDSDQPLHVAVARLLGYQWPRQSGSSFPDCPALKSDGLEKHADEDGIVCLSPVRGERAAADRLRTLLSAVLGKYDEQALIKATESKAKGLEAWLSAEFFEQHCSLFHHRPFIWHIWDGLSDGFHALINYHKLAAPDGAGRKLLESLTFSYLGDWIAKQQDGLKRNVAGAEDRLIAAQALQKELKAILAGEPPYDLFVRWKPLKQQAIGWEPDINDGVRLNIRPFLLANDVGRKGAGILRSKPNIKWDKDRGTEPNRPKAEFPWFWTWDEESDDFAGAREFNGNRWNDCHYAPATKRAARAGR